MWSAGETVAVQMQRFQNVFNRIQAQGTLVDPLTPQSLSHLSVDFDRSFPYSQVFELGARVRSFDRTIEVFSPSLSLLAALFMPISVIASVLCVWRLAADPGWTNQFFIAKGLLSHWQVWFAVAIFTHTSARALNKWLQIQNGKLEARNDKISD